MSKDVTFKASTGNFSVVIDGESCITNTMVTRTDKGRDIPIDLRLNELNKSPTGFNWGYGGSGPSQLAYCLLRECGLTAPQANKLFQDFKRDIVAQKKQGHPWQITKREILNWVSSQPAPEAQHR